MKKEIGLILAMGFVCEVNAGITLYGDGDGYDSHNKDWMSNTIDDIDSNGLGTDGYIFFGDFDGDGGNQTYAGGPGGDITAIAADKVTDVLPSYISSANMGADCNNRIGSFAGYEALDNPLIGDGTDGTCGNIVIKAPSSGEALDFTVSGLPTGGIVRVGVVTVLNDDARARFDMPTISLTDGTDTASVTNLPNLSSNTNMNGPGWVFFDLDSDGDYTVIIPNGSDTDGGESNATAITGLGGVTFDSIIANDGASLLITPSALSLDLTAPDTSASATLNAKYYAGLISSNDIEILSLVADSGFNAYVVDNTLGLSDTEEAIMLSYSNSVGGLTDGQSASSTLEVSWTELGSGVINTSFLPLDVSYSDPIIGQADVDVPEENWFFFDYDGNSTFTSSSPSDYSVDVADGSQDQIFPAEVQQFASGFDLSQVGQKLTAEFDVVMNVTTDSFDKDFRFGFFDTSKNVQIISMNDLGPISGSYMSLKIGNEISYNNGNGGVFADGDYATLSILYGSTFDSDSGSITNGLISGETNHIKHSIERISENELYIETEWSDSTGTATSSGILDETSTTTGITDYLPSGGYESFDGFGLQVHERFSDADYTLSNFTLTYGIPVRKSFDFNVPEFIVEPSGDVTLTLSNAIVGVSYMVKATDDLMNTPWAEVGSYVAVAPGTIVVPAEDVAPYIGDNGFFVVVLPLTVAE